MEPLPIIPAFKLKKFSAVKKHFTYASLLTSIMEEIKKIPEIETLKLSQDLTSLICNIIESVKISKSATIDKKTLACEILQKVFDLSIEEQAQISAQVDFICSNELHIEKSACLNKLFRFFF